jgi:hypothetical protein
LPAEILQLPPLPVSSSIARIAVTTSACSFASGSVSESSMKSGCRTRNSRPFLEVRAPADPLEKRLHLFEQRCDLAHALTLRST